MPFKQTTQFVDGSRFTDWNWAWKKRSAVRCFIRIFNQRWSHTGLSNQNTGTTILEHPSKILGCNTKNKNTSRVIGNFDGLSLLSLPLTFHLTSEDHADFRWSRWNFRLCSRDHAKGLGRLTKLWVSQAAMSQNWYYHYRCLLVYWIWAHLCDSLLVISTGNECKRFFGMLLDFFSLVASEKAHRLLQPDGIKWMDRWTCFGICCIYRLWLPNLHFLSLPFPTCNLPQEGYNIYSWNMVPGKVHWLSIAGCSFAGWHPPLLLRLGNGSWASRENDTVFQVDEMDGWSMLMQGFLKILGRWKHSEWLY